MGALKQQTQMDLFPELTVAYRAEQFRKIRQELQEVQLLELSKSTLLTTVSYTDKPIGLKNRAIRHDDLTNELSQVLRTDSKHSSLFKSWKGIGGVVR